MLEGFKSTNARRWLLRKRRQLLRWPPIGMVRFGSLKRVEPISTLYGYDRGLPVDRYYIESFLQVHSDFIRGHVLEVDDPAYTIRFGGENVIISDVLDIDPTNPYATIIGDLESGKGIPSSAYNCMILTQTLHLIHDIQAAVANVFAALKPAGVVLATFPGISKITDDDPHDRWGDQWRLTSLALTTMFGAQFGSENVVVGSHGNVLTAAAFLHGLAAQELSSAELAYNDPDYEVLLTVFAQKPVQ